MLSAPFFSVIIPAYNAQQYIRAALDSVSAQTLTDYEVVVTNDGSTDGTLERIHAWRAEHPAVRLRVACQANAGLGKAQNTAISLASGEFLAFLDADDRWTRQKLSSVKCYLDAYPDVDVLCHDEFVVEDGKPTRVHRFGPNKTFEQFLFRGSTLSPSATVARRTKVIAVGMFPENRDFYGAEDLDLWLRLSRVAKIEYLHEVLAERRIHSGNLSGNAEVMVRAVLNIFLHHLSAGATDAPRWKVRKRIGLTYYGAARTTQRKGRILASAGWYLKSIRQYPFHWKAYAGIALLLVGRKT